MTKPFTYCVLFIGIALSQPFLRSACAKDAMTKIEAGFELPQVKGNPFDYTENDVEATIVGPKGNAVTVPAFYDGGTTWRVRHTANAVGKYTVQSVTLNGKDAKPQHMNAREFDITAAPGRGFVRIDPRDPKRFAFDDGSTYYPVGYNLAWHQNGSTPMPPLPESIGRMGKALVNWTRIWMNAWDGKNLDWTDKDDQQPPLGQLSLVVARRWDDIVNAAEANGVCFQMVLQHHGQYTTRNDTNWAMNPWNKANGGWLAGPIDFFSDEKAKALTKAKYRYILARWGYSPSVMSWELFNEVESTNAYREQIALVGAWHEEMAKFLRQYDVYKHLITTSSTTTEAHLWTATDYYQSHTYPSDILAAIANLDAQHLKRPYFLGEFGGPNSDASSDPAGVIHRGLWGSLMSQSSGAAEYWFWYLVEPEGLLYQYTALQKFIELSKLPSRESLSDFQATVETPELGPLNVGPGINWAAARETHYTIPRGGKPGSVGGMSAFLQGQGENLKMFPFATFDVDYATPGTFGVHVDQITPKGAQLELSVDGQPASSLGLVASPPVAGGGARNRNSDNNSRINAMLAVPVPAGRHTVRMENKGADWVHIRELTLTPYAWALGVLGKGNNSAAAVWIYRRDKTTATPITGTLSLPGMQDGNYRVVWWDTYKGTAIKEETAQAKSSKGLAVPTPPVITDIAVFIEREKIK